MANLKANRFLRIMRTFSPQIVESGTISKMVAKGLNEPGSNSLLPTAALRDGKVHCICINTVSVSGRRGTFLGGLKQIFLIKWTRPEGVYTVEAAATVRGGGGGVKYRWLYSVQWALPQRAWFTEIDFL